MAHSSVAEIPPQMSDPVGLHGTRLLSRNSDRLDGSIVTRKAYYVNRIMGIFLKNFKICPISVEKKRGVSSLI